MFTTCAAACFSSITWIWSSAQASHCAYQRRCCLVVLSVGCLPLYVCLLGAIVMLDIYAFTLVHLLLAAHVLRMWQRLLCACNGCVLSHKSYSFLISLLFHSCLASITFPFRSLPSKFIIIISIIKAWPNNSAT